MSSPAEDTNAPGLANGTTMSTPVINYGYKYMALDRVLGFPYGTDTWEPGCILASEFVVGVTEIIDGMWFYPAGMSVPASSTDALSSEMGIERTSQHLNLEAGNHWSSAMNSNNSNNSNNSTDSNITMGDIHNDNILHEGMPELGNLEEIDDWEKHPSSIFRSPSPEPSPGRTAFATSSNSTGTGTGTGTQVSAQDLLSAQLSAQLSSMQLAPAPTAAAAPSSSALGGAGRPGPIHHHDQSDFWDSHGHLMSSASVLDDEMMEEEEDAWPARLGFR